MSSRVGPWRVCCAAAATLVVLGVTVFGAVPAGASPRPPTKPGLPRDVTLVPADGGVSVSWKAPFSDGGSPITGYKAYAEPDNAACTTTGTTCAISGLNNGEEYYVRVKATNAVGTGRPSPARPVIAGQSTDCNNFTPGADLEYCRLDGRNLAGKDLESADLTGAKLVATVLTDADLDDATLTGADATNANLEGASLVDADLSGTYLIDTVMTDTDLDGATLTGDLSGVSSGGITGTPATLPSDWLLADGYLVGPGADLNTAALGGADLTNADLDQANLTDAGLAGANLTDADLGNADLDGADLDGATLTGVVWYNTTCPDGTNSNNDGGTCVNNLA
jgi:uncharacterized protein YjbI with pentapeptide repeats